MAKGRATVEARLQAGIAVTPLGLGRSPVHALPYDNSVNAFGHAQSFRCPHYLAEEGGLCGIWRHRNGICATWFCKTVRGAVGVDFWQALKRVLVTIEDSLARWCVIELEVGDEALSRIFASGGRISLSWPIDVETLDGLANPEMQRAVWGKWWGREREFYRKCARLVGPLTWAEVCAICGPELQAYAKLAREAYRKLTSDELPARLKVGAFITIETRPDFCRITPDGHKRLDLSQRLMGVLRHFDGRSTAEALSNIIGEEKLEVSEDLIRRLVDFRVLVACNDK